MTAIDTINAKLREYGTDYDFDGLFNHFADGLEDALRLDDDYVTIKIPSGSEFSVERHLVSTAVTERCGFGQIVQQLFR